MAQDYGGQAFGQALQGGLELGMRGRDRRDRLAAVGKAQKLEGAEKGYNPDDPASLDAFTARMANKQTAETAKTGAETENYQSQTKLHGAQASLATARARYDARDYTDAGKRRMYDTLSGIPTEQMTQDQKDDLQKIRLDLKLATPDAGGGGGKTTPDAGGGLWDSAKKLYENMTTPHPRATPQGASNKTVKVIDPKSGKSVMMQDTPEARAMAQKRGLQFGQ